MARTRKTYTAAFKVKVALAALKGDKTLAQLASEHSVHANLITAWRKQLLEGAEGLFGSSTKPDSKDTETREAQLFEEIGRLKFELDWVKKKSAQ